MDTKGKAFLDFGFQIDRNSPTPLNIQLRDGLRTYIRNHFFDPDPVLPPAEALSVDSARGDFSSSA